MKAPSSVPLCIALVWSGSALAKKVEITQIDLKIPDSACAEAAHQLHATATLGDGTVVRTLGKKKERLKPIWVLWTVELGEIRRDGEWWFPNLGVDMLNRSYDVTVASKKTAAKANATLRPNFTCDIYRGFVGTTGNTGAPGIHGDDGDTGQSGADGQGGQNGQNGLPGHNLQVTLERIKDDRGIELIAASVRDNTTGSTLSILLEGTAKLHLDVSGGNGGSGGRGGDGGDGGDGDTGQNGGNGGNAGSGGSGGRGGPPGTVSITPNDLAHKISIQGVAGAPGAGGPAGNNGDGGDPGEGGAEGADGADGISGQAGQY